MNSRGKYLAIFRMRFTNSLQYRAAALAGMATQFAWGFMELLAFSAFYRADPAAFPMTFPQMVSYIWIQQAFFALFSTWFYEREIFDAITTGAIAYELVRPVDLYGRWFYQSVANRLSKAVLRCFPVLLMAVLVPLPFRISPPESAGLFALFLLSAALSVCVVVAFLMLVYVSAFYTLSSYGVRVMAAVLGDFMAGAIVPLPFFPEKFRWIAELTPFAAMQNMPLRIYSGNIAGMEALRGIILQVFWLAVLVCVGRYAMNKALQKVVVQGG